MTAVKVWRSLSSQNTSLIFVSCAHLRAVVETVNCLCFFGSTEYSVLGFDRQSILPSGRHHQEYTEGSCWCSVVIVVCCLHFVKAPSRHNTALLSISTGSDRHLVC